MCKIQKGKKIELMRSGALRPQQKLKLIDQPSEFKNSTEAQKVILKPMNTESLLQGSTKHIYIVLLSQQKKVEEPQQEKSLAQLSHRSERRSKCVSTKRTRK